MRKVVGFADKILRKANGTFKKPAKKVDNPIRWGIIGLGYMAECFGSAIDGNPNGVVAAVGSRRMDKAIGFAKKHYGCKAFGSYEELMQDDSLDVIYIATPTKHHYENIKDCLKYGRNVLCEKPITSDAEQLEELILLAKKRGCFLMEGMWMKCLPSYQKAKQWIADGMIGTVDLIKCDFNKREIIDTSKAVFDMEQDGGVLRDYGVYAVAFPTGFAKGMPKVNGAARLSDFEIDSDWHIHMDYGRIQAFISISSDYQSLSKAAIMGGQGTIEWESQFNRTNKITLYDAYGRKLDEFTANYEYEGFEYEVEEVQRALKAGWKESIAVPLESSLITQKIITALLREAYVKHNVL